MIETKVNLNIVLKGSTPLSAKEIAENPKNSYEKHKVTVSTTKKVKKGKKVTTTDNYEFFTKKTRDAILNVNLSKEAYTYMTSSECPTFIKNTKEWYKMNTTQRLEAHLDNLCKAHNGLSYTYFVFAD